MMRSLLFLVGLMLGLSTLRVSAQPSTTPPSGAPTMAADGSGEAQGQGHMQQTELSDTAARSHFRIGEALYAEGRFAEAAREFEQAYVLSQRPQLLYNAYVAYRDANDLEHAIVMLDEYIRRSPEGDDTPVLRNRLASMRTTLESRMTEQSSIEAERARLEAERAELAQQAEAERRRAEAAEQQVARTRSPTPFVVGGAGLAVLAGAGVAALMANHAISNADAACPNHLCPRDAGVDLAATRDSIRRPAIATDVLLGVGGATLVTGVVMLLVQRSGADETPAIAASCTGRGCSAAYSFRF